MATRYPYHRLPLRPSYHEIRLLRFDDINVAPGTPLACSFRVCALVSEPDKDLSRRSGPLEGSQNPTLSIEGSENPLAFSAVSYTWGDNPMFATMVVDGCEIVVPLNTELALRRLIAHKLEQIHQYDHGAAASRERQHAPLLWIDALCIDQENLTEKSQQVDMMCEIYSRADEVLVWLGNDCDELGLELVELLNDLYADCARATDDFANLREVMFPDESLDSIVRNSATAHDTDHIIHKPEFTFHKTKLLATFFSLPWFSRIWIVQEISLARWAILYWGVASLSWQVVSLAAEWFHCGGIGISPKQRPALLDAFARVNDATSHCRALYRLGAGARQLLSIPEHSLATLLPLAENFNASDPRDNVYALLGLLPTQIREHLESTGALKPDYSLDAAAVFTQATRAAIFTTGETNIFKNAGHHRRSLPDASSLPSWVARYDQQVPVKQGKSRPVTNPSGLPVFYPEPEYVDPEPASRRLRIRAHILHTVSHIGPAIPVLFSTTSVPEFLARLSQTWRLAKTVLGITHRGGLHHRLLEKIKALFRGPPCSNHLSNYDEFKVLFALTLCCGRTSYLEDARKVEGFLEQIEPLIEDLEKDCADGFAFKALPLIIAIDFYGANRHFFLTSEGFGMGPPGVQLGDRIAFVSGYAYPFILRPVEDHWLLIGDVYWSGFMDGQHFTRLRDNGTLDDVLQWIDIY